MEIETVRLKFEVSKETKTLIGFVTRSSATWRLRGVSEKDECPKKICVLAQDLQGLIEPGIVYEVELRPMRKGHSSKIRGDVRDDSHRENRISGTNHLRTQNNLFRPKGRQLAIEPYHRRGRESTPRAAGSG